MKKHKWLGIVAITFGLLEIAGQLSTSDFSKQDIFICIIDLFFAFVYGVVFVLIVYYLVAFIYKLLPFEIIKDK